MLADTLRGLIPVLATPFDPDGRIDDPSLVRLVEFTLAANPGGLAVFGVGSEGFALSLRDRVEILRHVSAAVGGSVPIVAGVNGAALEPALEQAEIAIDGGADALMVLPPSVVKPSEAQILDFYGELAASARAPIVVQDAADSTGVPMPVPLLRELCTLSEVVAVKVETHPAPPKVAALVAAIDSDVTVLGGQNGLFCLDEYACGAVGTMPACDVPDLFGELLALWEQGSHREARAAFARLLPFIRFSLQPGLAWAIHKDVLVRRGVIATNTVRSPARALDAATLAGLDVVLEDLGLPVGVRR